MKFTQAIPITEIANRIGATIIGNKDLKATGINEIHKVEVGDITFSDLPKYFRKALNSAATIIILNQPTDCPLGKALLICDNPFEAYDGLVKSQRPFRPLSEQQHPSAYIHPSAVIEPGVYIAPNVRIGAYTYIQSNVYIGEYTTIGEHVRIHANTTIGTDAFYFQRLPKGYKKWRSGGQVIIEDEVDIGAGCTISKGVSGATVIGRGTKLDCQVHVGHGAVIGAYCLIAGQVGIGGKTILEDEVVLYGQVGVAQKIRIGKGAVVAAKSGVSKSLEGGKTYFGIPAEEIREHHKRLAVIRRLAKE
ncbi:MAG: LpxD N-terminal domain-containing protein [Bacteroidota bacterium]